MKKINVLHLTANSTVRAYFLELCQQFSFEIHTSRTIKEASLLLRTQDIHVLVTDFFAPEDRTIAWAQVAKKVKPEVIIILMPSQVTKEILMTMPTRLVDQIWELGTVKVPMGLKSLAEEFSQM